MRFFPDREQRRANRRVSTQTAVRTGVIFAVMFFLAGVVGLTSDAGLGQALVMGVVVALAIGVVSAVARRRDARSGGA